jgi:hypothetical protein
MWVAHAGIVLVVNPGSDKYAADEIFNEHLAHEYGFLHGQGKDILFLIERSCYARIESWAHVYVPQVYPFELTEKNKIEEPVRDKIVEWLRKIKGATDAPPAISGEDEWLPTS